MNYEKIDDDKVKRIDTVEIISIKEISAEIKRLKDELDLYLLKTEPDQETLDLWNKDNFMRREQLKDILADKQQILTSLLALRGKDGGNSF
jgi:hypothetical protein